MGRFWKYPSLDGNVHHFGRQRADGSWEDPDAGRIVEDFAEMMRPRVVRCTRELCRGFGIPLAVGERPYELAHAGPAAACDYLEPSLPVHAICGFGHPELYGDLVVRFDPPLLERTLPLDDEDDLGDERELLWDWAREIANQLTGLIKGELHAYGWQLKMTPPVNLPRYAHGTREHLDALPPYLFRSTYGNITIFLSVFVAEGVDWSLPEDA